MKRTPKYKCLFYSPPLAAKWPYFAEAILVSSLITFGAGDVAQLLKHIQKTRVQSLAPTSGVLNLPAISTD